MGNWRRWFYAAWIVLSVLGSVPPMLVIVGVVHPATATGSLSDVEDHEQLTWRNGSACGVERWAIKTGIDPDAAKVNTKTVVPTTIFHLRGLSYPGFLPPRNRIRPVETTVYRITGKLLRYKLELDSDVHLVVADSGGRTMIVEIPAPFCVGATSAFVHQLNYVRKKFDGLFHPSKSWQRPNATVTVTGVGFWDFKHGQSGVAPNAIELHPLLGFRLGGGGGGSGPPPSHPTNTPTPAKGFTVTAWVSPSTMPYGARPTLYGKTTPGASCTASVIYSTGSRPRSFAGSAQTAGGDGMVSWTWHEETKGNGGDGTVTCQYRGQTRRTSAHFTVTG